MTDRTCVVINRVPRLEIAVDLPFEEFRQLAGHASRWTAHPLADLFTTLGLVVSAGLTP